MKIVSLILAKILFFTFIFPVKILEVRDIIFDPEEHTDFVWFSSFEDMVGEFIVPYLLKILADESIQCKKNPLVKRGFFLISF
mgnify:CR=1 FL=1